MKFILKPLPLWSALVLMSASGAQAQVTMYGRANIDFEKISLGGTAAADAFGGNQRVSSNSSRFGLRAAKDFEGLKVFAQLETGVSWDAGGDTIAGRDTFAGLEGAWGKLRLGKMETPMKAMGGLYERFKGTGLQDDGSIAALGGSGNGFSRRQNNSLRLDSPVFAGVKLALQYGFDNEDVGSSEQKKVLTLGVDYASGPLRVALAYETHKNFNTVGKSDSAYFLGANYDFGFINVGAGYNRLNYELAVGTARRKYATVTANVPVGKGAINVRYGKAGGVTGSAPVGTTVAGGDGAALYVGPNSGAQQFTLGYEHTLFKGAQAYAYWTKVSNQANANYRFGVNALNVAAAGRGASPSGVVIGMLYDF
jgi:predicted porin